MGIYGYKYVWMLSQAATYPHNWWKNANNCTSKQMEDALQGHFNVDILSAANNLSPKVQYNKRSTNITREYIMC